MAALSKAGFPVGAQEEERLQSLARFEILDTEEDPSFDRLTQLAARLFDCPISLVSLVDRDRQWFKSHTGLAARETPRSLAFCNYVVADRNLDVFVVNDADQDPRFCGNALVTGHPHIRFYAGAPIVLGGEKSLVAGSLCVISDKRRAAPFSDSDKANLKDLALAVADLMELHRESVRRMERVNRQRIVSLGHALRNPLHMFNHSLAHLAEEIAAQKPLGAEHLAGMQSAFESLMDCVHNMSVTDQHEVLQAPLRPSNVNLSLLLREVIAWARMHVPGVDFDLVLGETRAQSCWPAVDTGAAAKGSCPGPATFGVSEQGEKLQGTTGQQKSAPGRRNDGDFSGICVRVDKAKCRLVLENMLGIAIRGLFQTVHKWCCEELAQVDDVPATCATPAGVRGNQPKRVAIAISCVERSGDGGPDLVRIRIEGNGFPPRVLRDLRSSSRSRIVSEHLDMCVSLSLQNGLRFDFTEAETAATSMRFGMELFLPVAALLTPPQASKDMQVSLEGADKGWGIELAPSLARAASSSRPVPVSMSELVVVCAEDEITNRLILVRLLRRMGVAESNIVMFEDGDEMLDRTFVSQPHICLLDIVMNRMNGDEACRRLRARGWDCPMIATTGNGGSEEELMKAGFTSAVFKPFSAKDLEQAIRRSVW